MRKLLLRYVVIFVFLSSCVSTTNQKTENNTLRNNRSLSPISTSFNDVDTSLITHPDLPANQSIVSLIDQPRTEEGSFVLTAGLYEADFKTYCLQPGTPGPSSRDVYFQADLKGSRKDIIQTILTNSQKESHLDQENIQLLLWSVVSHSDFNKLSPDVKYTATKLLSPKQIFQLQGGVVGLVKQAGSMMPSSVRGNDMWNLFDLGISSYEAYERIAVVNSPSVIKPTSITKDHWYKQEEGYYIRYIANTYKETRIQVYVPDNITDSTDADNSYVIFDPVSSVVVPANSNAQRLGVGAPVSDIIRSVIRGIKIPQKKQAPKTTNPPKSNGKSVS